MRGYSVCEVIIGVLIIIFAIWQFPYFDWLIVILGIILILHSFLCKGCKMCGMSEEVKPRRRK